MLKNEEIGINIRVCRICAKADRRALRKGWPHCTAEDPENKNGHCTGLRENKQREEDQKWQLKRKEAAVSGR